MITLSPEPSSTRHRFAWARGRVIPALIICSCFAVIAAAVWSALAGADRGQGQVLALASIAAALAVGMGCSLWRLRAALVARERAERLARESREEADRSRDILEAIVEGTPDAVFVKDTGGRYVLMNRAGLELAGKSPAEVVGRDDSALFGSHDAAAIMEGDRRVMQADGPQTYEEHVDLARRRVTLLTTKGAVRSASGGVIGLFGISRDITDRQRADDELRRANRALRVLLGCSQAANRAESEQALMGDVCRVVVEIGGYQMAWAGHAAREDAGRITPVAYAGVGEEDAEALGLTHPGAESVFPEAALAIRTGRPAATRDCPDASLAGGWRGRAAARGLVSGFALPLRSGSDAYGALGVYSGQAEAFDEAETVLLADLAAVVAGGVAALRSRDAQSAAEAALRDSEERLRRLGDNLPESYVYQYTHEPDGTPRFLYVSAGVVRVHGVTPEQVLRDSRAIYGQILPEQVPGFVEAERASRDRLADFDRELQIRTAGHQTRWLRCRSRPRRAPDGSVIWDGVATDITPRKAAEEARRQELAFTDAVLNSLPGVLYCYDDALRFRQWNASFERVSGYTADEVAAMRPLDFFTEADRPLLAERIGRVFTEGSADVEADFLAKDGTRTPYFFTGCATSIEGRPHLVGVGIDVSSRRKAEYEVRRLNDELTRHAEELERRVAERTAELEVARDRAEAADRLKSAFLATMSHELRTPLNSIIGFTGILLQQLPGPLNEEQRRQMGMVRTSARHLLALINDILDLSKIEAGQLTVHQEAFDLRQAVQHVIDSVRPLADAKALVLREDVAPGAVVLRSDRRRVEQILLNLLYNAVKFTEAGSVTLRVRTEGPLVRLAVADTGIGLSRREAALLFQPFRQVDTGLTRRHEGTGLGLAICLRLARLLGGGVGVESEPGVGSTFTLTLPLDPPGDGRA